MDLPKLNFKRFSLRNLPPLGSSGIYVIKDGSRFAYVGESHTGRLRKTFLRHFQTWNGKTAGVTYPRNEEIKVAWAETPAKDAFEIQLALIEQLRPRDNQTSAPPETWAEALGDVVNALNPF